MDAQANAAFWCQFQNVTLGCLVLAACGWHSIRSGRVTPHLAMAVGWFTITWMEGPFDWTFWCQFNPLLARFPDWGPWGVASGGVPLMIPFGYVFFFAVPVFLAVVVSQWMVKKGQVNAILALLLTGLVIGTAFDVGMNILQADAGWQRFARGLEGVSVNVGKPSAYSLHESMMVAPFMMYCTYLLGRRDESNRTLMEAWAERHAATVAGRSWMTVLAAVGLQNLLYGLYFIPCFIAKHWNLLAEYHNTPLFHGLPPQPGEPPDPTTLWLGVVIVPGIELAYFIAFLAVVWLKDPLARAEAEGTS